MLALTPLLAPVGASAEQKSLRVGIMSAEDEDVWAVVAEQAKQKGLDVKLIVFNDYTQPNEALENGELDANAFPVVILTRSPLVLRDVGLLKRMEWVRVGCSISTASLRASNGQRNTIGSRNSAANTRRASCSPVQ